MRFLIAAVLLIAAATYGNTYARADMIDLSTMTCKKFVESDKEEISYILAWLDAYYKGDDDPAVIDTDKLVANAKKLGAYCGNNPTIGLITATDKLFGNE